VQKLREEFLEGVVLEVTFRLGLDICSPFINFKQNVSAFRPDILMRTADEPFCLTIVFLGMMKMKKFNRRF
jgi:hypothetical protein